MLSPFLMSFVVRKSFYMEVRKIFCIYEIIYIKLAFSWQKGYPYP
jgi:hypothetical protein